MRGALAQESVRLRTVRSTWWLSAGSLAVTLVAAVAFTLTAAGTTATRTGAEGAQKLAPLNSTVSIPKKLVDRTLRHISIPRRPDKLPE